MRWNGWTITGFIIAILIIIAVIIISFFGIYGYFDTKQDPCIKLYCNDTILFYKGMNQSIAHVYIQDDLATANGLVQKNSDYYDTTRVCSQVPGVINCYYYPKTCGRSGCNPEQLVPVRQIASYWGMFFLALFLSAFVFIGVFTCGNCSCNCCSGCCSYWRPYGKWSTVSAIAFGLVASIVLMSFGIAGFMDNYSEQCFKVGCSLQASASNSQVVNSAKVTIQLNLFDSFWHLQQPQYTYLDNSKNNCSQVDDIIPCFAQGTNISTQRINNNMYAMFVIAIIIEIVALVLVITLT